MHDMKLILIHRSYFLNQDGIRKEVLRECRIHKARYTKKNSSGL